MRPKPDLHPGWKMTRAQHSAYWRLLQQAYRVYNQSVPCKFEDFRVLLHYRAFGPGPSGAPVSAKDIDRMKMFGDLKAACTAIINPNSLDAQLAIAKANDPRTRLIHRILQFPATYILGLLNSPRFAHCNAHSLEDLESMTEKDLTDLRNTLCARNPQSGGASVPASRSEQAEEDAWWQQESQKEADADEKESSNEPF